MSQAPPFASRRSASAFSHRGLYVGTAMQSAFSGLSPTPERARTGSCSALVLALNHAPYGNTPSFRKPADSDEDASAVYAEVAIKVLDGSGLPKMLDTERDRLMSRY